MGVYIYGKTIEELLKNAAAAFSSIITGRCRLKTAMEKKMSLQSASLETLLFLWLSEFLYLYDASSILPTRVEEMKISKNKGLSLEAKVSFGVFSKTPNVYIKAITMHQIKVEKRGKKLRARVVLDL